MEYINLHGSDLKVSRLTLGCEQFGGIDWGPVYKQELLNTVSKSLDLGINTFDTADVYGLGKSEKLLSAGLGSKKNDVIIMSKFGMNWKKYPGQARAFTYRDASPSRVIEALENSLRRLRIDSISIYYIHWPDSKIPIESTMEALIKSKEKGLIQNIGVSNFPLPLLKRANMDGTLTCVQIPYNLFRRTEDEETLEYCQKNNLNIFTYGPLAQGFLTGKYNRQTSFPHTDRRYRLSHFSGEYREKYFRILDQLELISKSRSNLTIAQMAIGWVLRNPAITSVIIGSKTADQITENCGALNLILDQENMRLLTLLANPLSDPMNNAK